MPGRHIALTPEAAAVYDAISGTKGAKGAWVSGAVLAAAGHLPLAEQVAALQDRLAEVEARLARVEAR